MKYVKPKKSHEDNLKAELVKWSHQSGIRLHLEYSHKKCRFDAVVVREGEIIAIIEVKNWTKPEALRAKKKPTKQLKRYSSFGLPVFVLWSFGGVKKLVHKLKNLVNKYDDRGKLTHKPEIIFYPKPKEPSRRAELHKLIKSQARDMKYGTRCLPA